MHYKDQSFEGMKNHLKALLEMNNKKASEKKFWEKVKGSLKNEK